MNNKTMIYILIFVVIFFLIIDIVTLMMRKPNFNVVFYDSDIYSDYSDTATITTVSGLKFNNEKKKNEYIKTYQETSKETFEKYFSEISKEIGKTISVVDVKFDWKEREGILEITEQVTLKGLVQEKEGSYIIDMGRIKMNPVDNSNLKVHMPSDAMLEYVEPTPTTQNKNIIIWTSKGIQYFPKIMYKRGEKK